MEGLLILLIALGLMNESETPVWSELPQDCPEIVYTDTVDLVTAVENTGKYIWENTQRKQFICVEQPEVIRLPAYKELLNLPPAENMPIVAVYSFLDKTGQRKDVGQGQSFSTAVSQGGVELLIDALKTAGGGTWFRVAERQGLDNLIRERQIIRSGREEVAKALGEEPQKLGPMLFAGMIIEGGIIGFDTNVQTGGRGARLLGIGKSKRYQQDVVTVSIRAVSVLTGEVLLNVQAKKTILSYGGSGDIFKFVDNDTTLLEYEDGVGNNESVTYAVRTAIEAAVLELVYQGHDRGFWTIEEGHRHPHQVDGTNDKHSLEEEENE